MLSDKRSEKQPSVSVTEVTEPKIGGRAATITIERI
jgi:hypothetical protein